VQRRRVMTATSGADHDIAAQIERLRFAASVLTLDAWIAQDAACWMEILRLVRSRHPDCDSISLHGDPLEVGVWKQRQLIRFVARNDPLALRIAATYDLVDDPTPSLGPEGDHRSIAEITEAFDRACAALRRSGG
jgi:hypothetical protein